MAQRSDKQNLASAQNGSKSRGPVTFDGKAKSSQNAYSHGLTGAIGEETATEIESLRQLRKKLEARFDRKNAANAMLIERVLMSTLRLNRARAIITLKIEDVTGQRAAILADEASARVRYMLEVEAALCEMTGEKKIDTKLLHLLAENAGFGKVTRHYPSTKLDRLLKYAQRFRGERDSALKKLEKLRSQKVTG